MRDLEGRCCLITGASSGIGRVAAEALAARGARLWLGCRDLDKTRPVLAAIAAAGGSADHVPLDLSDLSSVRACAEQVLAQQQPLHLLINNAGQAGKSGLTRQGYELLFGVNHLGHFLLTQLLMPRLLEASSSRVVNVSSIAHYNASSIDFEALRRPGRSFGALHEYAVSKLANVLHTKELARRYAASGLHAYSLHPGVVASDIWRRVPQPFRALLKLRMISNEEGAKTTLYCATSLVVSADNGLYYDACQEKTPSLAARDAELAARLWRESEAFVA